MLGKDVSGGRVIREDCGESVFQKAFNACRKQVTYYATLGHGRLAYFILSLTIDTFANKR
jgi:hypothetical protein